MKKLGLTAAAMLAATIFPELAAAQDAASGEDIFNARCTSCHTSAAGGPHRTGPNLFGVMGSTIGGRDNGFRYSSALSNNTDTWTEANMDAWLESPAGFIPGNRMSFGGLASAQDRTDVIAFLNTLQ